MKIAVFTLCYNETVMLPFFMQHYRPIADLIVVNDNESTDGSRELALQLGADEVREFSTGGEFRDDINSALRNECWKGLKGRGFDWIIMVDMDEMLYHDNLRSHLGKCKRNGVTVCVPQGYQMVSTTMPENNRPIIEQVRLGTYSKKFSKPAVFDPDAIDEMRYTPGAHRADPSGRVVVDVSGALKLMHFRWLSLEWMLAKNHRGFSRMSEINKSNRWGHEYNTPASELEIQYKKLISSSFDVIKHVEPDALINEHIGQRRRKIGPVRPGKRSGGTLTKNIKGWLTHRIQLLKSGKK